MQCPRCQQDNSSHALFCPKCGAPVKPSARNDASEASYPELQRSLSEALARPVNEFLAAVEQLLEKPT